MVEIKRVMAEAYCELVIEGSIDASSSIHLENSLEQVILEGNSVLLINMSGLTYISSAGLGAFISKLDIINQRDIQMIFFQLSPAVASVFEILGIGDLLDIVADKETAIGKIK